MGGHHRLRGRLKQFFERFYKPSCYAIVFFNIYISYHDLLPDITTTVFAKAGGDAVQEIDVVAESPAIKKTKRIVKKPIVMLDNSKKRIKRAASSILGMQKRQVGKFEKKKGTKRLLFDVSNDSDENANSSLTLDDFFLSPKKPRQICVPETPTV